MCVCVCVCVRREKICVCVCERERERERASNDFEQLVCGSSAPAWFEFISHKVFIKSFCRSQLPHKSAILSFTIADIINRLTDLCGN